MPTESATSAQVSDQPVAVPAVRRGKFFLAASAVMLCVVLIGFAPTFYLRGLFFEVRPIPVYIYVHGAVLTGWFALLLVQTSLIATRRVDMHRRLGVLGLALGVAALIVSPLAPLGTVRRLATTYGLDSPMPFTVVGLDGSPIETVMAFAASVAWGNIAFLLTFAVFLTCAVVFRRRPDVHKRLMVLASISVIGPALTRISRWPVFGEFEDLRFGFSGLVLFVVALVAYDYLSIRRVHRATAWGGAFCIVAIAGARIIIADTEFGQALVRAIA